MKIKLLLCSSILAALTAIGLVYQWPKTSAQTAYTLTVNKIGGGGGTVSGSGISCGGDCSESYPAGTTVTVSASTDSGRRLAYWTNVVSCSGGNTSSTCQFVINQNISLGVIWDYSSVDLTIQKTGSGSGTVTGSGINCGGDCSHSLSLPLYPSAGSTTSQSLTASPAADSVFVGWETSGNVCYSGGGKGGAATRNTSPSCNATISSLEKTYKAVALFEKKATSSSSGTSSGSGSAPNSAVNNPSVAKDEIPSPLVEIKLGDEIIKPDQNPVLKQGEYLLLSGKTIANATINIYVFSEPKKYSVQADKDGSWNYSIGELPPGDHHAEAEVWDPSTGKTSPRTKILAFTVEKASSDASASTGTLSHPESKNQKKFLLAITAIIAPLMLLAGYLLVFKRSFYQKLRFRFLHK